MSQASEVYVRMQMAGALMEVLNMDPDDMAKDTPQQLISALNERGIELRPM